jgi:hypothetical protein
MIRYLFFIFILATSFSQTIDERLLLNETQKILTYMDKIEQITIDGEEEYAVASNVANSIARSINIVVNAYHLIHIYNMIEAEEDKLKVGDYLRQQIPRTSGLLKIEIKLSKGFTSSNKSKQITEISDLYVKSLDSVMKLLNTFN